MTPDDLQAISFEEPVLAYDFDAFGALIVWTASHVYCFRTVRELLIFSEAQA